MLLCQCFFNYLRLWHTVFLSMGCEDTQVQLWRFQGLQLGIREKEGAGISLVKRERKKKTAQSCFIGSVWIEGLLEVLLI